MAERAKILVLEGAGAAAHDSFPAVLADAEIVRSPTLAEGLARLQAEPFDAVVLQTQDPLLNEHTRSLLQADSVLEVLNEGVAVVGPDLRVTWANATFEKWCGGNVKGRAFYEALGSPEILGPDYSPFHTSLHGKITTTRLHRSDNHYLDLQITPVLNSSGKVTQLIGLCRDVTDLVQQNQKLQALHQAGRELAALSADQLSEMGVQDRIELLKLNIKRFTHDLLHYDVIEIRLLDPQTGKLEPLLAEGMLPEAEARVLYAKAEGNGVTGYVAATGKSYLCNDTANDPLYIEGAKGARSSLTVALMLGDRVIGTLNVESPQANAFVEQDLQYAEIFSREIASALHTLELLSAEKRTTASQSVEAINREVVLPVDEILTNATSILDKWIGHEPEMADKLRQILASARSIKQCIQKVGEDMGLPAKPLSSPGIDQYPRLRKLRVLLADNDERVRRSAHSILGRFGATVETARDAKEALTMARICSYDAIIVDIRLPDMAGYEVYQKLRAAQPTARVILMTAYGYDPSHAIVKARQDGLNHVLYKPFRVDQLLDALEKPEPANTQPQPVQT